MVEPKISRLASLMLSHWENWKVSSRRVTKERRASESLMRCLSLKSSQVMSKEGKSAKSSNLNCWFFLVLDVAVGNKV